MDLEELGPILHHHPALAELDYSNILLNDALAFSGREQQLVVKRELSFANVPVPDAQSLSHVPEDKDKKKAENGRRKRKRRKSSSGKTTAEESEKQRMTHIAVERNRRRVMNEHLTALRSLMPPCYVHKGDQASIVAAAIDYVKQLEQLLQSHRQKKQLLEFQEEEEEEEEEEDGGEGKKLQAGYSCSWRSKSPVAEVQVRVVQNHASLNILCVKRCRSQLLDIILAFENLRLTVLHLNVTTSDQQRQYEYQSVHYSFSLRIEDDCKMGRTAPEIAEAVHQIFHRLHSFWAPEL